MQVVVIDTMPVTVTRTPQNIEQADPDLLKAFVACGGGTSVIYQDGRQAELRFGELTFYDTRRPYGGTLGTEPGQAVQGMTFMFPPSMLPLSRNRISEMTATRIPATSGLGELTSQFLLQLARNVDHYTPAEAARLSTAALEVLATRLARVLEVRDWGTLEPASTPCSPRFRRSSASTWVIRGCRRRRWLPRTTCRCGHCISCSTTRASPWRGGSGRAAWSGAGGTCPTQCWNTGRSRRSRHGGGFQRGGLQPGVPRRARHAARRIPKVCADCEAARAVGQRHPVSLRRKLTIRPTR